MVVNFFYFSGSGFRLVYHRDHGEEVVVEPGPNDRSYIATPLLCGTTYRFTLSAYNRVGNGIPSHVVTERTNGSRKY